MPLTAKQGQVSLRGAPGGGLRAGLRNSPEDGLRQVLGSVLDPPRPPDLGLFSDQARTRGEIV